MKKLLFLGSLVTLFIPGLASASYDDVALATTTDISVNSITLNVSGSSASIESIAVDSSNFTVVLQAGSSFKISAPSLNTLAYDVLNTANESSDVDYICTGSAATLEVSAVASTTIIVTPSSSLCADAVESSSSGSGKGSGGGGGGGGVATVVVAAPAAVETAEINALMAQIATLQAQIAALSGTPAASVSPGAMSGKLNLTANMSRGTRGASVKSLQQFLNTHGFVIASSGPGSPGNETDLLGNLTVQAIQKFQKQYGIADVGTPGYGTVGPKTRAKINELSAQ